MLHPYLERELGRERVVQLRREVDHDRLEARLMREDRLARAASLSEEARLAKEARLREQATLRRGILTRGTTFVAALFR